MMSSTFAVDTRHFAELKRIVVSVGARFAPMNHVMTTYDRMFVTVQFDTVEQMMEFDESWARYLTPVVEKKDTRPFVQVFRKIKGRIKWALNRNS